MSIDVEIAAVVALRILHFYEKAPVCCGIWVKSTIYTMNDFLDIDINISQ